MLGDRFFLFSLAVFAVLVLLSLLPFDVSNQGTSEITGIAKDPHSSSSGFVFTLEDTEGRIIRCFSYTEPTCPLLYTMHGGFSSDGNMFFVREMYPG
ncbi:MAG: hypothetical protein RBQ77_00505 [Candidatus Methanomethylophilaceae archaeon]|nr:hypothetical protein [Candidatus Methanomethylophilaceae archaeon]